MKSRSYYTQSCSNGLTENNRRNLVGTVSLWAVATASSIALFAPQALAQTSAQANVNDGGIADIVVTAQKYEQNLQETPISIVAVQGEELESMGVSNIGDFGSFLPNVSIGGTMSQGTSVAAFSIRGVGGAGTGLVTQESSVGVYIDDILFARPNGALLDLLDVERIEVLRGPQGTLFGRNTAGGAVRYVTKSPEMTDVNGYVKATIGNYNRRDVSGALNLPLSDTLAVRAVFAKNSRDGFVHRIIDNTYAGSMDNTSMRAQLRWKPTDRLDINLSADTVKTRDNGTATVTRNWSPTDQYVGTVYANNATGASLRQWVNPLVLPNLANNLATGGTYAGYSNAADDINFYANKVTGAYQVYGSDKADMNKLSSYGLAGTIAYDLTDDITVKSLTGYRKTEQQMFQDTDRTPLPIAYLRNTINIEYLTQELQLTGKSLDDRLNWVVGAYYYWDHSKDGQRRFGWGSPTYSSVTDDLVPIDLNTVGQGLGTRQLKDLRTRSYALYTQGTFAATDKLNLTAGLRWTRDEKDFSGFREGRGTVCVQPDGSYLPRNSAQCTGENRSAPHFASGHWTDVSPRVAVDYQWTPDVMTYASASRGFKGGGFADTPESNCGTDVVRCGLPAFKPETLWTYEAGIRTDLFDRKVRFNLTGFLIKYKGLQVEFIDVSEGAPIRRTLNAAMTVKGAEAELLVAPTQGLLLRANLGYTDATYDEDVRDGSGAVKIEKTVPYFRSPKLSYTLGANYTVSVADKGDLSFDVNWGWKDTQASTTQPTNSVLMPSYGLLNGRIEYASKEGWSLALVGTNLLDKYYLVSAFDPAGPASRPANGTTLPHDAVFGFSQLDLGRPREWGVEVKYKF